MKKCWLFLLFAVLAGLLIATGAVAEEAYVSTTEIAQMAKRGWHETYSAHGRTIEVDIAIDFPAVKAVPVRKVREAQPIPVQNPERWQVTDAYFLYEKTDGRIFPDNGWYKASVERRADQIDWDAPLTDENRYTPRQAFALFWPELAGAFSKDVLDSLTVTNVLAQGHLYAYNRKTKAFGKALTDDSLYSFSFTQAFDSIPILYAGQHALFTMSGSEGLPPLCRLDALVVSPEHFSFSGSLVEAASTVYEDIPLASLKRVLSVYEELIYAGRLREVQALRFGYLLGVDPQNPEESYTIPIWVLDGVLFDSPTEEAPPMPSKETMRDTKPYRSLIVYAQSAELLDVNSTSPLRRTAPSLLSWTDISP